MNREEEVVFLTVLSCIGKYLFLLPGDSARSTFLSHDAQIPFFVWTAKNLLGE